VGLSLSQVGAASATTKPVSIATGEASVVATINALRTLQSPSVSALVRNGFVDEYAGAWVSAYANCNGCGSPKATEPTDIIPLKDWDDIHPVLTRIKGTVASTLAKFKADVASIAGSDGSHGSFDDTYGSVAMVSRSGYIYEAVLFVEADPIPNRLIGHTPTITGSAIVGHTMTAHTATPVPADAAISYKWERQGGVVVANTNTYVPTAADVGQTFIVINLITEDGYEGVTFASKHTAKTIRGTMVRGKVMIEGHANLSYPGAMPDELTADRGAWTPLAPTFSYQWYANGHAIAGATAQTYDLPTGGSIKGKRISVKVSASQPGWISTYRVSAATAPVGLPLLPGVNQPKISGDPTIGSTLTASNDDEWRPGNVRLSWKWLVNGKVVPKATKSTFVVPASAFAKVNGQISVIETGNETGFAATSSLSTPDFVVPIDFTTHGSAWVNETTPGHTIGVHVSGFSPSPTSYHYQWYRDGFPVVRATKSTILTSTTNGHTYYAQVTASRLGYTPVTFLSTSTLVNRLDFTEAGTATVNAVTPGHTLSVHVVGFVPGASSYAFQWYRDGVAVSKATRSTFVSSKGSHQYWVIVTAHRANYNSLAVASNTVRLGPA
jgi:hypothetical protein